MNEAGDEAEPPSWLGPPLFMVGQDCRGNWVVRDHGGTRGGLFVSREAALRFVRSENGNRRHAVLMISGIVELDVTTRPAVARHAHLGGHARSARRVA